MDNAAPISRPGVWQIDKIPGYCITLERRPDRWKRFQDQLGIHAMPRMQRFLGVDGNTLNIRTDPRVSLFTKRNILLKTRRAHEELDSIGGVGCALSHIALWRLMIEKNEPLMFIMEDDAVVTADFKDIANNIIQASPTLSDPTKWDLWLIGADWATTVPLEADTKLERAYSFWMAHGYVITQAYARRLQEDVLPIEGHIDMWMSNYAAVHKTRMVATKLLRIPQYTRTTTDIQTSNLSPVCDIPTNYTETHSLISLVENTIAKTAEVACVIAIGYFVFMHIRKML